MVGRAVVILLAAIAVGIAAYRSLGDGDAASQAGAADDPNAIVVAYAFSTNQEDLVAPLIERFNAERHETGGREIEIEGDAIASGEAEEALVEGTHYTLWSPASGLWGRLLEYEVDADWVPDRSPSLARTPLVVAMWEPEAKALGWPRTAIDFGTILRLATSRSGWAAYGLPAFGDFKLGHTNPNFSTSGMAFVSAQYYTATGKREGLTVADVQVPAAHAKVRQIEQSIVHYGDTASFFLDQLAAHGPAYVSAVAMEEVSVLEYNETRPEGSLPLVAVYPADGTFVFENPLITLDAPWVTPEQKRAARIFAAWLVEQVTPELAAEHGYRPGNPRRKPVAPIDEAHKVDPAQPKVVLALPEPPVLHEIQEAWHEDRKAANVALVVDTSGSMEDEDKLNAARRGLQSMLREFSPRDRVGVIAFADGVATVVPISAFKTNANVLRSAFGALSALGNTALYDGTAAGLSAVANLRDTKRINAVVVLSDGQDNHSATALDDLLAALRTQSEDESERIRIFTIAYGSDANEDVLKQIAEASGGVEYTGDAGDIEDIYRQISSYF